VVGLLPLASGQACFDTAFIPFLMKYYILIIKANETHYFSSLFGKELYMFRTDLLSIIIPNKQNTHTNIRTPKKNCVRPTRQYDITKYDITKCGIIKYDITKCGITKCGITKYDITKYDITKCGITNDITKYDITKCGITKYDVTKYDITKYDITKCGITKYDITKCGITKCGITKYAEKNS
jgi:uncharacterized low-complexity protein